MIENLRHTDKKYNHLKENSDFRMLQDYYTVDPSKFKLSIYKILSNFRKYEIDKPKKRLNNFLATMDIVKHFN